MTLPTYRQALLENRVVLGLEPLLMGRRVEGSA